MHECQRARCTTQHGELCDPSPAYEKSTWPEVVVNLAKKRAQLDGYWVPLVVGALNGQLIKLAKIEGEFLWHAHAGEDEMFLVVKGSMRIRLREEAGERDVRLQEGEFFIVPRGVEHCPFAERECCVLLFEPANTTHTGGVGSERSVPNEQQWRG